MKCRTFLVAQETVSLHPDLSLDWEEEMAAAPPHDCVPVPACHPLYILYTSGTTGLPKVCQPHLGAQWQSVLPESADRMR